jgi:hypothetical protein
MFFVFASARLTTLNSGDRMAARILVPPKSKPAINCGLDVAMVYSLETGRAVWRIWPEKKSTIFKFSAIFS